MKLKFYKVKSKISTAACSKIIYALHEIALQKDETGLPIFDNAAKKEMQLEIKRIINHYVK